MSSAADAPTKAKMTAKNTTLVYMTATKVITPVSFSNQKNKVISRVASNATRGGCHGLLACLLAHRPAFLLDAADSTAAPHFLFDRSCGTSPEGRGKESHVYVVTSVR